MVAVAKTKMMVNPTKQNVEGDLVGCLLALGALDELDHAIEKGRAGGGGDPHADPVGQHLGSTGDRRAVAAGLPDDRRGFTGDRRFVDRRDAFDDLAVGWNDVAGLDKHDLAHFQLIRRFGLPEVVGGVVGIEQDFCSRVAARAAESIGLSFAAAFRDGFGKVCKQQRGPQPQHDLERERQIGTAMSSGRE